MSDATAREVSLRVAALLRIPGALRWFLDRVEACREMEARYMAAKEERERSVSWQKYRSDIERIKSDPDNYINPLLTPVDPRWVWMSFTAPDGQPEEKVEGWVDLRDGEEMEPGIPIDTLPPSPFPDPLNDDDNRRPQQGQYDAGNAWLLGVIHDRMLPDRPAIIEPGFEAPGRMSLHLKHSNQIAWSFPEFTCEHIAFALADVEARLKLLPEYEKELHKVELQGLKVTVDSHSHPLTEGQAALVEQLLKAGGDIVPAVKPKRGKRYQRRDLMVKRLPEDLQNLIESKAGPGGGFRLKVELIDPRCMENFAASIPNDAR